MKRRLLKLYWLGIAITLVITLAALSIMVKIKIDDTREHLHSILYAASEWTTDSREQLQSLAQRIAQIAPGLRVTFMMEHGLVLADSEQNPLFMESHYSRPEVIRARADGEGESLRVSGMKLVFYVARRVSPNLLVRLSFTLSEITNLLIVYGFGLILAAAALFLIQRRALSRFSAQLVQQMEEIRMLLEGSRGEAAAVFPELRGAVANINYLAQRLNQDMAEVNRTLNLRSNFVANASHELRSPLTSIMGFAEMLEEGLADTPQEQQLCVSTIRSECGRMLMVIEDILHLSKVEGQAAPGFVPVDAAVIAQEVCQALSPQAAQKRISLSAEGSLTVSGVEKDVWEILYNLTDNAIRYGREGGYVRILLDEHGICVEDNGIGIAAGHIPHLFEQFYRVDEARDISAGGTGLGLSIVSALVTRMNGQIRVESKPGEGSRFIVTFEEGGTV